jgi:hypothetical protein
MSDPKIPETNNLAPRPPEMDLEPIPSPDVAGTEEQDLPPARTGKSENKKDPVEGAGSDNPTHHTGEQPLSPLSK